jgi:hypothetical protein
MAKIKALFTPFSKVSHRTSEQDNRTAPNLGQRPCFWSNLFHFALIHARLQRRTSVIAA